MTNSGSTQAIREATTAAGFAPSIHNTQPWRWRLRGDELDLFVDRSRTLEVTDPEFRLTVLSCGVALHHAGVSFAADGWQTTVTRLPDPADPEHLATVRVEARIPVDLTAIRHLRSIELRRTDRRPGLGYLVDVDKLRSITTAVEAQGARLHLLRPGQVFDLASAADQARRAETGDSTWQAELGRWTGGPRPPGTGIPDDVIPRAMARTTVPSRDFGHPGRMDVTEAHDRSAVFAILYGAQDSRPAWLRAGEALSAAWLIAIELEISVLPLSATIEVDATRADIRQLLSNLGYPFLVLRFGVLEQAGAAPHPARRPADQTVRRI